MATDTLKKVNWPRVIRTTLLPELPGFSAHGRLLYQMPVGDVLRAFQVEVSGFTKSAAYVECFVLPLYVPQSAISFDFGNRLRDTATGAARWEVGDEDQVSARMAKVMKEEGLAFLGQIRTARDLLRHLGTAFGSLENPHTLEALAYTQLLADEPAHAKDTLRKVAESLDRSVGWEREMHERVSTISAFVATGDLLFAHNQLAAWQRSSIRNLKLA
jgi:hypothetical protein